MNILACLPRSAVRILLPVALGWAIIAGIEALSFLMIALAIMGQHSPIIVLCLAGITIVVTVLVSRAGFHAGTQLVGTLYKSVGDSLSRAKLSWFSEDVRAMLQEVVTRNIPGFMSIPAHQIQTFIHAPLLSAFLVLAIGIIGGIGIMALIASLLVISFVIQYQAQRALTKTDKERNNLEAVANKKSLELVEHIELLRTACGKVGATKRIEQSWHAQELALSQTNRNACFATFFSTVASVLPVIGITVFLVASEPIEATKAFCLIFLSMRSGMPLRALALAGIGVNDQVSAIKNYCKTITAPTLADVHENSPRTLNDHNINVSHINYASILHDISFSIQQKACVLISGPSGSGKSTLLGLLMRFDDPDQGQVMLGDIPLGSIPYEQLAKHFAYVPQNPIVFTGTIASNIRLADEEASDEEVEKVARQAALGAVLDRSEHGIHQDVGYQGKALSGGECQRIAIARALLKKAPILIMDEATSALDEQTEKDVARIISRLESTVIIATHGNAEIWKPDHTIELKPSAFSDHSRSYSTAEK